MTLESDGFRQTFDLPELTYDPEAWVTRNLSWLLPLGAVTVMALLLTVILFVRARSGS